MSTVLQVATPEGESGRVFSSGGDYVFRYRDDAKAQFVQTFGKLGDRFGVSLSCET